MAAIYQWYIDRAQVLTTTLYPVEVIDGMDLSCQVSYTHLASIPVDSFDMSSSVDSMILHTVLKLYGPINESFDTTSLIDSMILKEVLKVHTATPEEFDLSSSVDSVSMSEALVTIDTPDEALEFSCALETANCSLTPI